MMQLPIPAYKALPNDPACEKEGLIVCHNGHIQGRQGVALDDLVYIMTRCAASCAHKPFSPYFAPHASTRVRLHSQHTA